ncbi:MAG: glycosyltransferase 87 family protein [bacterium]
MNAKKILNIVLLVYILLTMGILATVMLIWIKPASFLSLFYLGPGTNRISLVVSAFLTWILAGVLILMAFWQKITRENVVIVAGAAAISMLYLAILREHVFFGDYFDYIKAAINILNKQPFHARYVYPPLWASFLAHVYRFTGRAGAAVFACFVINHLSIVAFFILASLFLNKCGLSLNLSCILLFLSLAINVPVLRNMVYVQVNLLMADLILASVLLISKSEILSALSLALGAHVKVVPVLFLPLFLRLRKWKWLFFFLSLGLSLALLTILTDGASYYGDFYRNLKHWNPSAFRSCTVYSFLQNTRSLFRIDLPVKAISSLVKLVLAFWVYFLAYLSIQKEIFVQSDSPLLSHLINGTVPLLFLMIVLSPTVWVYHLVILIIPTILIFVRLGSPIEVSFFVFGYFFTFLMPAFDLYPWSYLRLAGWMILLGLMTHIIVHEKSPTWLPAVDEIVNSSIRSFFQHLDRC